MKRRTLLGSITAATVGSAGCVGEVRRWVGETEFLLYGIMITNLRPEPVDIEVVVRDDDRTYVDRTVVAEAWDHEIRDGVRYRTGGVTLQCGWPDEPAEYTARARVAGDEEWTVHEYSGRREDDSAVNDGRCEIFEFYVDSEVNGSISRRCYDHWEFCGDAGGG